MSYHGFEVLLMGVIRKGLLGVIIYGNIRLFPWGLFILAWGLIGEITGSRGLEIIAYR